MNALVESSARIDVLLVEDNTGDARLTHEAFHQINEAVQLHIARDGVEAMAFLRREGELARAPRPDLILLDLNLPQMDGREVLALIKKDDSLRMIPTIILTTSENEEDVVISYQLQASCYLRKPAHWEEFDSIIRGINTFWMTRAKVPQKETPG